MLHNKDNHQKQKAAYVQASGHQDQHDVAADRQAYVLAEKALHLCVELFRQQILG